MVSSSEDCDLFPLLNEKDLPKKEKANIYPALKTLNTFLMSTSPITPRRGI